MDILWIGSLFAGLHSDYVIESDRYKSQWLFIVILRTFRPFSPIIQNK